MRTCFTARHRQSFHFPLSDLDIVLSHDSWTDCFVVLHNFSGFFITPSGCLVQCFAEKSMKCHSCWEKSVITGIEQEQGQVRRLLSLSLCLIFKQIIGSPSVILVVLEARVVLVLALKWFKVLIYIFIFMLLWNDRKIYIEIFTLQSTHLTLIKL